MRIFLDTNVLAHGLCAELVEAVVGEGLQGDDADLQYFGIGH